MENRSNPWMPVAVVLAGMAMAFAILAGLQSLTSTIGLQHFASSYSNEAQPRVVPLSNDRFAVVEKTSVSVYKVDAQGRVTRLSDVDTQNRDLETRRRWVNPHPYDPNSESP
jgi:hypothetical protein